MGTLAYDLQKKPPSRTARTALVLRSSCSRAVSKVDTGRIIKKALRTDSLTITQNRRDAMKDADEHFWETSLANDEGLTSEDSLEMCRYRSARRRVVAIGFEFKPFPTLLNQEPIEAVLERVKTLDSDAITRLDTEAVLGTMEPPKDTIRDAFKLYCDKLSIAETSRKSPEQIVRWRATKNRAVEHFVALCGNLTMDEIARKHGRQFYDWWGKRLSPDDGSKGLKPNSANRNLGNLRKLYRTYWTYEGQEERQNPFRELRFSDTDSDPTPPFSDEWVKTKILAPGALDGLHKEAQLIIKVLIETGCRPSEVANLEPEDIHLDVEVPFISIRPKAERELKSRASKREIPLLGIALEAMKKAPHGFPHYKDKSSLLSASLMKAFKTRGLFEHEGQRIYSFRHAFEKRMLEAGLD